MLELVKPRPQSPHAIEIIRPQLLALCSGVWGLNVLLPSRIIPGSGAVLGEVAVVARTELVELFRYPSQRVSESSSIPSAPSFSLV